MIGFLSSFHPIVQALMATMFTWFMTAFGAAPVLFTKRFNQKIMDGMLGLAAGVMIAASYWSLLAPAIEMSEGDWKPALIGFVSGGLFLYILDKILPHLHLGLATSEAEGIKTSWQRSVLLVSAITLHNIPEGLAVGVGFGAVAYGLESASMGGAIALALGIGIQNWPEGLAVAMPLRREGMGRAKAFYMGQASGVVEPLAGALGASLVLAMQAILPYALAFAAGAMIFVVVEELIPESQREGNSDFATLGAMLGFAVMMALDVGLG
ncbi:MAG TPA: ZIP family metal transporter [Candidatus Hydrogenedentes bacterium]|nr:ZIP family metal transporter [Candidatus Hydrogenedentota bacterium]HPG69473.1 ZIP family metal transporter [Candidatus Hydrogenedentota bacterium]